MTRRCSAAGEKLVFLSVFSVISLPLSLPPHHHPPPPPSRRFSSARQRLARPPSLRKVDFCRIVSAKLRPFFHLEVPAERCPNRKYRQDDGHGNSEASLEGRSQAGSRSKPDHRQRRSAPEWKAPFSGPSFSFPPFPPSPSLTWNSRRSVFIPKLLLCSSSGRWRFEKKKGAGRLPEAQRTQGPRQLINVLLVSHQLNHPSLKPLIFLRAL